MANECIGVLQAAWGVGVQLLVDSARELPPEVLFFAANLLHAKARRGWAKLPAERRTATAAAVFSVLQDLQTGRRTFHNALFSKLCAVYAVALVAAPDECNALLRQLVAATPDALASGDRGHVLFFLTFARCVGDELEHAELPFAAKDAMEMYVSELSKDVTRAIAAVVATTQSVETQPDLSREAFGCLTGWIHHAGLSLPTMFQHDRALLVTLIDALCTKSPTYLPVCAEILCKAITVAEYPAVDAQEAALSAVATGLLQTRAACASALVAEEDAVSHAITRVVSTFCETYVDWIVADGAPPEAVALGELMLVLGAHPRRQIASLTLEFWLLVQDEPVVERHVFFQHESFRQLFDVLLRQCRFAHDATEMDELELDDLLAFRIGSQGVADAFLAIFALQSEPVLAHVAALLADADEWPSVEVCLFVLSTLADDVKQQLAKEAASQSNGPLDALVTQIFACVLNASSPHPLVATTAAKLLGQFGAWFNKKAEKTPGSAFDIVAAVLQYLDSALGVPQSRANAAKSFMQVATACAESLAHMPSDVLVAASVKHFASGEMAISDRLAVVEGLVRAAAVSAHCTVVLDAVLHDTLSRLDQVLALGVGGGSDDVLVATIVCNELQVLSKVVRFLDAPSEAAGGKAVTASVVHHLWPHLAPVIPRLRTHEPVMDALFQLYGWCLQSLRDDMASQLGVIADAIVLVFDAHQFVAPLECAAVAVDVFGKRGGDGRHGDAFAPLSLDVARSFQELMGVLSRTAFRFFTTHALGDAPDVLRAFFELAYRFVLFCPVAVLPSSDFPVLVELGLACVGNQDRASTNAVLVFLSFVVTESRGKLARFQAQIDSVVLPRVDQWVDAIVTALAVKSPSVLFDALGRLLFALLSTFEDADAVHAALLQALTTKSAGLGLAELSPADCERVLQLWMRLARAPTRQAERRFRGLCADVAKICRRELPADALEVYEWDA